MKIFSGLAFLLLLFASSAWAWPARVVYVPDGDTIHVEPLEGGERVKVRLYGVDCPERRQPYGEAAKGLVTDAVLFKVVELEPVGNADRYGRSVAIIWLEGQTLQELLLEEGLAWFYPQYCKREFCKEWKDIEGLARSKGKGLWADEAALPPWKWRKGVRCE